MTRGGRKATTMAELQEEMKDRNKVAQSMIEMAKLHPMKTEKERVIIS